MTFTVLEIVQYAVKSEDWSGQCVLILEGLREGEVEE